MKLIQVIKNLPIPDKEILVWAFIPWLSLEQDFSQAEFNPVYFQQELTEVFAELDVKWKFKLITLENMKEVIEEVAASQAEYLPVVLNYCAGLDEADGYPGLSVIKLLEAKGIIFTGADSNFEYLSISKIRMKDAFSKANVSTAPYEVISDINQFSPEFCERLGSPLIIKSATSYGSCGLSLQSVVASDEDIIKQVKSLSQGQHGINFSMESIFVERFINGPEFTVLIVGSTDQPESLKVYPPVELTFNSLLPETERFLSHDRYGGKHEGEIYFSLHNPFFRYQLVGSNLHRRLCDLAKRAYCAVGGNGYGRVDIRMDKVSQELFVLEVNANCVISSKPFSTFSDPSETPVGTILHLSGTPFTRISHQNP